MASTRLLHLATLAALASVALAADNVNTAVTDDGQRIIAGYTPSVALSVLGMVLYGASASALWTHWYRADRRRYMLTLNVSLTLMTVGFVLRIIYHGEPASLGRYIAMTMFILLSASLAPPLLAPPLLAPSARSPAPKQPCGFLANNYILLSRLSQAMGSDAVHALFIPAHHIGKIFVWSDVVTFLLQAAGGGLTASGSASSAKMGSDLALAGLIIQLISYCLFTSLLIAFFVNLRRRDSDLVHPTQPFQLGSYRFWAKENVHDWRPLYIALCLSSVGVIVRSMFRIVEYSQGYYGTLATGEGYFYLLDALPLWLAMTLYVFFFPARFIEGARETQQAPRFSPVESTDAYKMRSYA